MIAHRRTSSERSLPSRDGEWAEQRPRALRAGGGVARGAGVRSDPVDASKPESATERYLRLRAERLAGPPRFLEPATPLAEDGLWRGLTREGEMRVLVAR